MLQDDDDSLLAGFSSPDEELHEHLLGGDSLRKSASSTSWLTRKLLFDQIPASLVWESSLGVRVHAWFRFTSLLFGLWIGFAGFWTAYWNHPELWFLQFPNWSQTWTILYFGTATWSSFGYLRASARRRQKAEEQSRQESEDFFRSPVAAAGSEDYSADPVRFVNESWIWKANILLFQLATIWGVVIGLLFLTVPHRFKTMENSFFHWATPLYPSVLMLFEVIFGSQRFAWRHFQFQVYSVTLYFLTTYIYTVLTDKYAYSYLKWNTFSVVWLYVASLGVSFILWPIFMWGITWRDDRRALNDVVSLPDKEK